MSMIFKELGDYVVIKKTEFQKMKVALEQYENKKDYSRNYMRNKYMKQKLERMNEKEKEKQELEEISFQLEHIS